MHLKAKTPIFAPRRFWPEIEKLSKAALIDLVWDYATTSAIDPMSEESIMTALRERAETIKLHRKQNAESDLERVRRAPDPEDDYADRAEWAARR